MEGAVWSQLLFWMPLAFDSVLSRLGWIDDFVLNANLIDRITMTLGFGKTIFLSYPQPWR